MKFPTIAFALLEPEFLRYRSGQFSRVPLEEADGVVFKCPRCYFDKGNTLVGVHSIICWEPSVPADALPGPGRWSMEGTSVGDLSLVAGSSSVHLDGPGCGAHFFVRNGEVVDA